MNKALQDALGTHSHIKISGCDIDGIARGKLLHAAKFKKSVEGGFGFCNVVFGWDLHDLTYHDESREDEGTGYPDINAKIDLATIRHIPWENRVPHFIVDFCDPRTNLPVPQCPRGLLKQMVNRAESMGFKGNVGIEYEFYNFAETPESISTKEGVGYKPLTPGMFGYSVTRPVLNQSYFYEILSSCNDFKIPIEGYHTETGPGVYEVAIAYSDPVSLCDSAHLFKTVAKSVGIKHKVMPTFMAKPHNDLPGCSGHIHISLSGLNSAVNLFAASEDRGGPGKMVPHLSPLAENFLAGVLEGLPSVHACFAPTINSYKRLVQHFWAPVTVSYGVENRLASIRIIAPPTCPPSATRLEVRVPGADCNPYIAVAAIIACGLEGIAKKLELSIRPLENHVEGVDPKPARLSRDLREAVETMAKENSFARRVLGDGFVDHFVRTRRHELRLWDTYVTNWERIRYFETV